MTTDPPLAPAELAAMAMLAAMAIMLLSIGWMRVAMRGGDIGTAAAAAGAVEQAGTLDKQTRSKKPARAARAEISGP